MSSRIDPLRTALHVADWDVIAEEPGSWVLRHRFLPAGDLTLALQSIGWNGRDLGNEQAYGCHIEEHPDLSLYLSRNTVERRRAIAEFVDGLTRHAQRVAQRPRAADPVEYVINVRNVPNREQLFRLLARTLNFPDHFGGNWSALDDCMRDLQWLDDDLTIRFQHLDRLAERAPSVHRGLVEGIDLWSRYWDSQPDRVVRFVGQEGARIGDAR